MRHAIDIEARVDSPEICKIEGRAKTNSILSCKSVNICGIERPECTDRLSSEGTTLKLEKISSIRRNLNSCQLEKGITKTILKNGEIKT